MFHSLPGLLVRAEVIAFAVPRGGDAVRVCGLFVEFRSSLMRIVWHFLPPECPAGLPAFTILFRPETRPR